MNVRNEGSPAVEFAWFGPCCGDDYEFLGTPDPALASTPAHVRNIALAAEAAGFKNILLPSGYVPGVDPWTIASALSTETSKIQLLPAIRVGEQHLPMFARAAANLDHMMKGRLTINIISSPLVGLPPAPAKERYTRTQEFMRLLKMFWRPERVKFSGQYYQFDLDPEPCRPYQPGGPLLYFGGASPEAKAAAAAEADVYLFWGEPAPAIRTGIEEMSALAAKCERELLFGLRVHVIARQTEAEAIAAADRLVSKLEAEVGDVIRQRSLDRDSVGKQRQNALLAQGEWVDTHLWTGVGRARGGCGTAIVGSYEQVEAKLREYISLGIRAFILSGYPHLPEAERFGQHILPRFEQTTCAEMRLSREGCSP